MRKWRTNAGNKVKSDGQEVALAAVHNTKYRISLDYSMLSDHGVFYPKALAQDLEFQLTLAPVSDIVSYGSVVKIPNYTLTNIEMEYKCITSDYLANIARSAYQTGRGFYYENILLHKTFTISKPNDSVVTVRGLGPAPSEKGRIGGDLC